jgi:Fe-S-cluster containining protein
MACHLAETGAAESVLARLAASPTPAPCVLFEPDPTHPGRGRCGHYAWRPSLCRLFGFAATRDKYGRLRLAACKIHKETRPETVQAAESGIESGTFSAPSFDDAANALLDIDPEVRSGHAPINTALRRALERVLWKQTLRDRTG